MKPQTNRQKQALVRSPLYNYTRLQNTKADMASLKSAFQDITPSLWRIQRQTSYLFPSHKANHKHCLFPYISSFIQAQHNFQIQGCTDPSCPHDAHPADSGLPSEINSEQRRELFHYDPFLFIQTIHQNTAFFFCSSGCQKHPATMTTTRMASTYSIILFNIFIICSPYSA